MTFFPGIVHEGIPYHPYDVLLEPVLHGDMVPPLGSAHFPPFFTDGLEFDDPFDPITCSYEARPLPTDGIRKLVDGNIQFPGVLLIENGFGVFDRGGLETLRHLGDIKLLFTVDPDGLETMLPGGISHDTNHLGKQTSNVLVVTELKFGGEPGLGDDITKYLKPVLEVNRETGIA
jgi:hypothetical protein